MKPYRQHVALAIDGGGIRGAMVAKALAVVEAELGQHYADLVQMTAGTSTGSILSAAVAARIPDDPQRPIRRTSAAVAGDAPVAHRHGGTE